jgi:hypothetical protein
MTGRIIGVFMLPSLYEGDWRIALKCAAEAADWDYQEYWGLGEPPLTLKRSGIAVTMNLEHVSEINPDEWFVLSAAPQEVMARTKAQFELGDQAALGHAAHRLAAAATLVEQGASLWAASRKTIDFPGLGSVSRSELPEPVTLGKIPDDAAAALQLYSRIPVPSGASAVWPASIFSKYGDDTPGAAARTIDLTGRGRILIHGPYLSIPAGRWRATFEFEFETPVGSAPFRFDWGEEADIVHYDARAFESGRYAISLEKDWPVAGRAEVRIWVYHAIFQGEFRLLDCAVTYLGPPGASDTPTQS